MSGATRLAVRRPGISVAKAAAAAALEAEVHATHEPTEDGLATVLWELAEASNCELGIDLEWSPVLAEGSARRQAFNLDPLATDAPGALLLTAPAEEL